MTIDRILRYFIFFCATGSSALLINPLSLANRRRIQLKKELLDLVKKSPPKKSGRFANDVDAKRFENIFLSELPTLNPTSNPTKSNLFSGEWECVWTNEKELNLAVRSGLPGSPWKRTYQQINIPERRLDNFIEFENAMLTIRSSIEPDTENFSKFNFRFSGASITWRKWNIPFPPVGKGWGELLYLDEDIRLQRDIRGDLLLARRVKNT